MGETRNDSLVRGGRSASTSSRSLDDVERVAADQSVNGT